MVNCHSMGLTALPGQIQVKYTDAQHNNLRNSLSHDLRLLSERNT